MIPADRDQLGAPVEFEPAAYHAAVFGRDLGRMGSDQWFTLWKLTLDLFTFDFDGYRGGAAKRLVTSSGEPLQTFGLCE